MIKKPESSKGETKRVRRVEQLAYAASLRELGCFSVQKRRLEGNLNAVFHYLKEWRIRAEDGSRCFSEEHSERTRSNNVKLQEGTFQLGIIKKNHYCFD